jgi:hypothetical protein
VSVLILVLSSHVPPYGKLHDGQRRTWDSLAVPGVETQYYFCETWDTYTPFRPALDEALRKPWTQRERFTFPITLRCPTRLGCRFLTTRRWQI